MSVSSSFAHYFFFNDTATTEIYTLSLHDALPICDEIMGREVIDLDEYVFLPTCCPGQAHELTVRDIGVSLVGLPDVQQAVIVALLNRGVEDYGGPRHAAPVGSRGSYRCIDRVKISSRHQRTHIECRIVPRAIEKAGEGGSR